jgi:hypothetical protein
VVSSSFEISSLYPKLFIPSLLNPIYYIIIEPKSVNFIWPSSVNNIFSGFKSLYIISF